jgi:glycosyltransferase involved in cell wall biosynthesis
MSDGPGRSVVLVRGPSTGGIRRHVDALADALETRGWVVRVVAVGRGPRAWRMVRRHAAGPDVVHAHGQRAGWWAALAQARWWPGRRPRLVVTIHNVVLDEVAGRRAAIMRWAERALPRGVDAVIATSAEVASAVGAATAVIAPFGPPPTPARRPQDVRRDYGIGPEAPLVVAVGRLHRQKGFDVLLDAVPAIVGRVPGARVLIVGDGPLRSHLGARVLAEGPGGASCLGGPTDDSAGVLAAADVVAVPSLWESGPLVLTEAMILGRPVVVTPVGFAPELVDGVTTGRLVPIGDAAALAAAIGDVLTDPAGARAMGVAGRRRAEEWSDPVAAVDEIIAVYDGVSV